jgi:hypothetical protein
MQGFINGAQLVHSVCQSSHQQVLAPTVFKGFLLNLVAGAYGSIWQMNSVLVHTTGGSSVGIAKDHGFDSWDSIIGRDKKCSPIHRIQTCSSAHPLSYPVGLFPYGKATRV